MPFFHMGSICKSHVFCTNKTQNLQGLINCFHTAENIDWINHLEVNSTISWITEQHYSLHAWCYDLTSSISVFIGRKEKAS